MVRDVIETWYFEIRRDLKVNETVLLQRFSNRGVAKAREVLDLIFHPPTPYESGRPTIERGCDNQYDPAQPKNLLNALQGIHRITLVFNHVSHNTYIIRRRLEQDRFNRAALHTLGAQPLIGSLHSRL